MTACPPGRGSAVSPAPRTALEPADLPPTDGGAARPGRGAAMLPPAPEVVPPVEAPPDEQPEASRQPPAASTTIQAAPVRVRC